MLSIIIPTLNEEKYLPDLLDSINKQSLPEHEIIVSDGASTDATVRIAKKYGCRIVVNNRRGPARQRNAGANEARGNLLLFLDADTRFSGTAIAESLRQFRLKNLNVASFYFDFDTAQIAYRVLYVYGTVLIYLLHFFHPVALGAAILVEKNWFIKSGGFNEEVAVGEDHLLALSVKQLGGTYGLLTVPHMYFSLRRFRSEGFFTVVGKWHYFAWYYLWHGPFSESIVPYEFGKYNAKTGSKHI